MPPIFNASCENPKMHIWCKFGDSSSHPLKVTVRTGRNSYNSESKQPNDLEGQGQWLPLSIPAKSIRGCMFGANLLILAQIYDELLCGQAEFPRILSQNGQNDLEGQGQWPPFSIPAENIPWCTFGTNLVIQAQICDELSCGQGKVYGRTDGRMDGRTDGRTDRQTKAIPLRPERPRGNKNRFVRHWNNTIYHVPCYILMEYTMSATSNR